MKKLLGGYETHRGKKVQLFYSKRILYSMIGITERTSCRALGIFIPGALLLLWHRSVSTGLLLQDGKAVSLLVYSIFMDTTNFCRYNCHAVAYFYATFALFEAIYEGGAM